jgi:hypothetical protein
LNYVPRQTQPIPTPKQLKQINLLNKITLL